jgi:hypothetical protein
MMGVLMCSVIGDVVYLFFPDNDRRSGEMSFSLKRSHCCLDVASSTYSRMERSGPVSVYANTTSPVAL